jgi:hypothetical protein
MMVACEQSESKTASELILNVAYEYAIWTPELSKDITRAARKKCERFKRPFEF